MSKNIAAILLLLGLGWGNTGCESGFSSGQLAGGPPAKVIWPKNTPRIPEKKARSTKLSVPASIPASPVRKETVDDSAPQIIKNAAVEEVDVLVMESYPQQIMAVVTGTLPDKATELNEVEQTREGNTIKLTLTTRRERSVQATMALIPFKKNIPVGTDGLEAGTYQLDVNGVKKSFSFMGRGKATMAPTLNSNPSSLPPPVEIPLPPSARSTVPEIPLVSEPAQVVEPTPPAPPEKPALPSPTPVPEHNLAPLAPGVVLPN